MYGVPGTLAEEKISGISFFFRKITRFFSLFQRFESQRDTDPISFFNRQ